MIGDAARLRRAGELVGEHARGREPRRCRAKRAIRTDNVECIDLNLIPADLPFGKTSAIAGEAAYRYIERAVRIVEAGRGAGDLHGAAQQGSAARRGPQVSWPHRAACGAHPHSGSLDDAGRAETARHSRDDAYRACSTPSSASMPRWWSASSARARHARACRHRAIRASVSAASIRTPAKTDCSAAAKKPRRSCRRCEACARPRLERHRSAAGGHAVLPGGAR